MADSPREEEERIFQGREKTRGSGDECASPDLALTPDVDPTPEAAKCDPTPETPQAEFLPPNLLPPEDVPPDLLPGPLLVFSQQATATCVDGGDPDRVLISGTYNDIPGQQFVVGAGYDTQSVFLDEVEEIPLTELYRLASYISDLQDYVDTEFLAAFNASDYTAFDAGLAAIPNIPLAIATKIREDLVLAQGAADAVAQSLADSSIICGYRNRALWVECQSADPGYAVIARVDNTQPPPTEVVGDVYELDNTGGGVHPNWDGASAGDVVEFNGTSWINTTIADNTQPPPTEVSGDRYYLDDTAGTVHPDWDGVEVGQVAEFDGVSWSPSTFEVAFVAAGEFSSLLSQADADNQAAQSAAFELECLVPNDAQDVNCTTANLGVDETQQVVWPVNWTFADAVQAALGNEVLTLEDQGVPTWTVADWDDRGNNTASIPLSQLNGQEFLQLNQLGSGERRRLRTRVIIPAGDPRAAAVDKPTANALALNLAISELDCFVPNRPRIISCMTPTYGSDEVVMRASGLGLSDVEAGRDLMFEELDGRGGAPSPTFGGPEYARDNEGILNYNTAIEAADPTIAFETRMWPGFVDADTTAEAEQLSGNYGSGYLQCLWISFPHSCQCVSTQADTDQDASSGPGDLSSSFSEIDVASEGVILDSGRSVTANTVERGLILSDVYPNKVDDPGYSASLEWPGLPDICQSGLSCLFVACKIACCEPKPDERPYKVNGMPNWATWNGNWLVGPAELSDQIAFIAAWRAQLSSRSFSACDLGTLIFDPEDYDSCRIDQNGLDVVTNAGPEAYGTPARFKYGGILEWGAQWAEPENVGDQLPPGGGDPNLLIPGEVKACHKEDPLDPEAKLIFPDPWGFFSCAEGVAEGYQVSGLGNQARSLAIANLDCTHIDWPRHLVNCKQPNQKPFGPVVNLNLVNESKSTQTSNEMSESILMPLLECRDMHNWIVTFEGNRFHLPGPSAAHVGGEKENKDSPNEEVELCIPSGLFEPTIYEPDCETVADTHNILANQSSHVFIEVTCCTPDAPKKEFILHIIPDPSIDAEIKSIQAKQLGHLGLPSGWATLNTLKQGAESGTSEWWYIASFGVFNLGLGKGSTDAERISVQVHSGPIAIQYSCCPNDSSSSSESKSSASESQSSGSSGGSSSAGSSESSGSGSDKSTAIVPMPWHEKEFGALFTMESNEVLFEFVIWNIKLQGRRTVMTIDPRFLFVCEKDSLTVVGAPNCDSPAHTSAKIEGDKLIIEVEPPIVEKVTGRGLFKRKRMQPGKMPETAALKLTGIRRGFLGVDMPERSERQFLANEDFLNSAYPAE